MGGFGDALWQSQSFQTIILTSLGVLVVAKLAKWKISERKIDDR
jgi:hypothetical protein